MCNALMILEYRGALRAAVKPELEMMPNVQVKRRGALWWRLWEVSRGWSSLKTMPSHCHYLPVSLMSWPLESPLFFYLRLQFSQLRSQFFFQHLDPFCGSDLINFIHGLQLLIFWSLKKRAQNSWLSPLVTITQCVRLCLSLPKKSCQLCGNVCFYNLEK